MAQFGIMDPGIKLKAITVVFLLSLCFPLTNAQEQGTSSTYGQEFFVGFMLDLGAGFFTQLRVVVGTPAAMNVSFKIESSNDVLFEGTTSQNNPAVVDVPVQYLITDKGYTNREKGLRVYTTDNGQIFVILENFITFINHGTYIAYPCQAFETFTEYEYFVTSVDDPLDSTSSQILLIACDDDTTVTIAPTQSVTLPQDTQSSVSSEVTVAAGTTSHQLPLHKMQTLLVSSVDDLSRTRIVANKPIAVISGHQCAAVPSTGVGCEPIAVQIPPTVTWGSRFLVAPFAGRTGAQTLKAVSSKQNTSFIFTCGTNTRGAIVPSTLTISIDQNCYIESSDPIFLTQLSFDGTVDSMGDPAIAIIAPVDQYINQIHFFSLPKSDFPRNYISITVAVEHYSPNSILLDGQVVSCAWKAIFNSSNDIVGYGCNTTISSEASSPTQHQVSHSDTNGRLSVLAYGFSTFPTRGYAYLTGQEIKVSGAGGEDIDLGGDGGLPLVDLQTFTGVKELRNDVIDSFSDPIRIPNGLFFGENFHSVIYVNENGVISFREPWKFSHPDQFPTEYYYSRNKLAVAPFWSDNDIRKAGAVRYATYNSEEGDTNPNGKRLLDQVNKYIQDLQEDEDLEEEFVGTWLLVVHWDHVHPSPHGADDHNGIPETLLEKTNNYQAVVVTNTYQTYAVFTYKCGDIQWSGVNRNQGAVIGFDAEGNYFGNHPLSGSSSIGDAVSCTFDIRKRRKRNQQPTDPLCNLNPPPNVGFGDVLGSVRVCLNAIGEDETRFNNLFNGEPDIGTLPNRFAGLFDSCPCTEEHARNDLGRYIKQPTGTVFGVECYVSGKPIVMQTLNLTQQCCYTADGVLVTDTQQGIHGTLLISHPIRNSETYEEGDKMFRQNCCPNTQVVGAVDFTQFCANGFFRRRPIPVSEQMYSPPVVGTAHGDPHYTTFDGRYYDFNGFGEYVLLELQSDEGDIPDFTLQGRLNTVSFWPVTTHKALAFGQPGLSFHFGLGPGNGFRVFQTSLEGQDMEITDTLLTLNGQPWFDPTGRAMLAVDGNNCNPGYRDNFTPLTIAFYDSGVILVACVYQRGSEHYINFRIQVPQSYSGRTQGFLGNFDSVRTNEFYERGSNEVEDDTKFGYGNEALLNVLNTWRISEEESLFHYEGATGGRRKRQTFEDFQNPDFTPVFFDDLTFTDEMRAACEEDLACLFDLAVTSDMAFASNTLDQTKVANSTKAILNNFPPNISGNATFQITVGVEAVFYLTVEDEEDDFIFTVQGGLPENALLQEIGDGEFLFRWNLQTVTNTPLIFIANDSSSASSTFIPIVEICACENGGLCTEESLPTIEMTNVNIKRCLCNEAFSGNFCEEDKNGCSEIQCFEGVECLDIPAPGVGAVCGTCAAGFTGDGLKCYDVDECALNATLCGQNCTNTDGGYFCDCREGYQLITGTNQCQDVNECEGINDCQQECVNVEGSYNCSCMEGFNLADDGRNCTAKVLCENNKGKCSGNALCAVIDDEEVCFCPVGFQLTPGGTECIDMNECELDVMPCQQICNNTEGSFECACLDGYQLQEDGHGCSDINECLAAALESANLCESNQNTQCVNNDGSYDCVCVPGYNRVNGSCHRIPDEPPPPPPPVVTPTTGIDNSLNYTTSAFTPETFTPGRQQQFRKITAEVVVTFCSMTICTLIQLDGKPQEVADLKIEPMNVAIPVALIGENDEGQLEFTFYVQLSDGFLSKVHLQQAVEQGEDVYREAFFPVTTTMPPTTEAPTTPATTLPPTTTTETSTKPPTTAATTTAAPTTTETSTEPPTTAAITIAAPTTTETSIEPPTTAATTTAALTTTEASTQPPTTETTTEQTTTREVTTEQEIVTPAKEICYMPSDPGPCQESSSRYYFNIKTGVCEEFMYGGCEGNENNFATLDECNSLCNPNDCPPFCTPEYCTARKTRTAECTVFNAEDFECEAVCRITTCRVCYYADEYRPLPDCDTCPTYPDVHNINKCFKKWGTCVRRANAELYPKARGRREKTPERFKCYEHPCK